MSQTKNIVIVVGSVALVATALIAIIAANTSAAAAKKSAANTAAMGAMIARAQATARAGSGTGTAVSGPDFSNGKLKWSMGSEGTMWLEEDSNYQAISRLDR